MSSWFISPWEAVRFSLEAQRLIALQLFPFAPRQEQRHQEAASDDKSAFVTPQNIGSPAHGSVPPQAKKTLQPRTVAAASNAAKVIRRTRKTKAFKTKALKTGRKGNGNRKRA
jgi:hypothetical protein